ncbi:MAG TPA: hypothetical protein VF765_07085 [Polyangiaceae bacterium]
MKVSRVAGVLVGIAWAAISCGNSSSRNGFSSGDDSGVDAGGAADSSLDVGPRGDSGSGDSMSLVGDGAVAEGGACKKLNIGILGNPGSNPSSDFQAWLVSAGTSVTRIQTMAPTPVVTAATLMPFDVVILDWLTRDYASAEAAALASFVSAGGGVISMSGYDGVSTDDWHANSLLAPLEVAYSGPLLDGPVTTFAVHPTTLGLTSVTFAGGYAVTDLGGTASTRTSVAFLPNPSGAGNVTVAYAVTMGSGHAFVWGDEWIEFDSEWSTLPEIKQLWVQVFAWVARPGNCMLMPQ